MSKSGPSIRDTNTELLRKLTKVDATLMVMESNYRAILNRLNQGAHIQLKPVIQASLDTVQLARKIISGEQE